MGRGRAGWRIERIRKVKVERRDLHNAEPNWELVETLNFPDKGVLFLQLSLGSGAGVQDCSQQVVDPVQRSAGPEAMPSGMDRTRVEGQVGAKISVGNGEV